MKTKQITHGAMMCAIYGVLLFLNQQTGLMIETSASWLFVFPILIYTAMNGIFCGIVVGITMALMTFIFGGFTTWFYSWMSLLTGTVYGIGLFYQWKNMTNFVICLIFSILSNICTVIIWSYLFGYDLVSEFETFRKILPFVDLGVFMIMFVVFLSLLQALCIHLVSLMICIRMHLPYQPITPIFKQKSSRFAGILSLFVWGIFFLCQNVVKCPKEVNDIVVVAWLFDCMFLLYYGVIYFMHFCILHKSRWLSFLVIFLAFVPGINFIWMLMGELDCLFRLREKK